MIDAIAILKFERCVGSPRATAAKNLAWFLLAKATMPGTAIIADDEVRKEFEYGAMLLGKQASVWYTEAVGRFVRPVPEGE